jgi:hypothetical protein
MNEKPAPRAQRRSPGGTWSHAAGSTRAVAGAQATMAATAVALTDDGEWQEF